MPGFLHKNATDLNIGPQASTASISPSLKPDHVGEVFIFQMSRLRLRKVMNLFELIPELVSGEAGREECSHCST